MKWLIDLIFGRVDVTDTGLKQRDQHIYQDGMGNFYIGKNRNNLEEIKSKDAINNIKRAMLEQKSTKKGTTTTTVTNKFADSKTNTAPTYNPKTNTYTTPSGKKLDADKMIPNNEKYVNPKKDEGLSNDALAGIVANAVAQATDPMKQYIKELESKLPEKLTADKAAEYYGINVNYDDILRDYNAKTNDYFDNASELMRLYRDQMQEDNANYNADALRSYLNSYRNAAPTASRKGATAASALLSMLGNSADLAQADSASGQNIINQEAQRRAELANNPYLAKEYENNLRTYLSTLSTGIHQADVAKHVGELNSYATRYAGERSGLAGAAMGTAYQYQGLANAYGTQAQANALNTTQKMYQFYLDRLGERYAPGATASALKAQTTAAKK